MATRSELLLAFYGDDFTGSTDAMEALALSGLRTVPAMLAVHARLSLFFFVGIVNIAN